MNTVAPRIWAARRARALAVALGLLLVPLTPVIAGDVCPDTIAMPRIELPHLRSAVTHGLEGVVVALGSSSTQGSMASDLAHSYPAVLQQALSAGLPQAHVAVINRGIGGQDASEELARLDADVLALRPQLVIWQVGANGALRNVDPAIFRAMVTTGVRRIQAAGADVILMDNQQSPRLLEKPDEPLFDQSLAQVAAETGASLFSRRILMQGWRRQGAPIAEFIATDGLHHNDHGYLCVAEALSHSILAGLTQSHPLTASR
jgi:lysophospholipase L1-like esterase